MPRNSILDRPDELSSFISSFSPPQEKKKLSAEVENSFLGDMRDTAAQGAGSLVQGIGTLFGGSDSWLAEAGERAVEYWGEGKSEAQKASDARASAIFADPNKNMLDVLSNAVSDPRVIPSFIAGSVPSMAASWGLGGLLAKGLVATGAMSTAGVLSTAGVRGSAAVAEGLMLVPEVYASTQGNTEAGLAAFALGAITSAVTPGNAGVAITRKLMGGGTSDAALTAFNKTAARRFGGAIFGESAQELGQETGQAVIEQLGTLKDDGSLGDLDMNSAIKQGTMGAIVGGVVGGSLHPFFGEGDPLKARIHVQEKALADRRAAAATNPNNPVLAAEVAHSAAQLDVTRIEDAIRKAPSDSLRTPLKEQLDIAKDMAKAKGARVIAERNPADQRLQDAADTAEGAAVVAQAKGDKDTIKNAAAMASAAGVSAVQQAPDIDTAIATAIGADQASSVLRTAATGIQNVAKGVDQAITEASRGIEEDAIEEFMPEQVQQRRDAAFQREIETLRLGAQQTETKLQREVESLRAQQAAPAPKTEAALPTIDNEFMAKPAAQAAETESTLPTIDTEFMAEPVAQAEKVGSIRANEVTNIHNVGALAGDITMFGNTSEPSVRRSLTTLRVAHEHSSAQRIARALDVLDSAASAHMPAETADAWRAISERTRASLVPQTPKAETTFPTIDTEFMAEPVTQAPKAESALPTIDTEFMNDSAAAQIQRDIDESEASQVQRGELDDIDRAEIRYDIDSLAGRLDGVLGFDPDGYPSEVEEGLRTLGRRSNASPQEMYSALAPMAAYVNASHQNGLINRDEARRFEALQNQVIDRIQRLVPEVAAPTTTPTNRATDIQALVREAAAEVEAESNAPAPARARNTIEGVRHVEPQFATRARAAKRDGTLDKLSTFWRKIMVVRGQRTLPKIKMDDLSLETLDAVNAGRPIPQTVLTKVQSRYNEALKRAARAWATKNNQPFNETAWVNPISAMAPQGSGSARRAGFSVQLRPLNRRGSGQNPYMVKAGGQQVSFSADYSIHATALQGAKGSADLAYRLAAEIAHLRGAPFPADASLLTVNNLRRQLQSMSSDILYAPGTINPLVSSGAESEQGVPTDVWAEMSDDQRIGLNALRAAHSITENRNQSGSVRTAARFLENLAYDRQGRIIAHRDPRTGNGFPRGTVVTDAMLEAKVGEIDPVTGVKPFASDGGGVGGVGASTAKLAILNNTILKEIEGNPEVEIPSWIETVAKREGRKLNGWFFSETEGAPDGGVDRDYATGALKEVLGDTTAKILLDSGIVSFVDTQEELTGDTFSNEQGRVQGATTEDGKIVLVLGNLTPRSFSAVLQHEGLHATLKTLVGDKTYDALMKRLETLMRAGKGSTWANAAEARVPANTLPENRTEEVAGYAVEQYVKGEPESNPLVKWAKDFMSALRAGILKSKHLPEALKLWAMNNLQPKDLSRLALVGLRQRARQSNLITRANGVRASTASSTGPLRAETNTNTVEGKQPADDHVRSLRLSVEEELAVSTEPVSPATPHEFNVRGHKGRHYVSRAIEKIEESLVDKHATLNRYQRIAGVLSEQIGMDTMGALHRMGSRLMTRQRELVLTPMAKMENLLAQAGWEGNAGREALDELLIAKHVAEYNAHIAEINPARYDEAGEHQGGYDAEHPGSGIADEAAAATIARLTSGTDSKTNALIEANGIYRQMIADLQSYAVGQGLETQETIDNWNKKFPNYTPFNRDLNMAEDPTFGTVPGSQGFSLRAGISRLAMGSDAKIVSPTASTLLFGMKVTTRGENAEVGRTMLNFARNYVPKFRRENGEWAPMFKVDSVTMQRVVKHVNVYQVTRADGTLSQEFYRRDHAQQHANGQQAAWVRANPNANVRASGIKVEQIGDGPQPRVVVQPIPNQLNQENVMVIPENGQNVVIEFDKESADAMRILAGFKGGKTIKLWAPIRMFSRWVQATATGYNPVFAAFNSPRDVQVAMLTLGADKIPGWDAADSGQIPFEFLKAMPVILKQLNKEFRALHSNESIDTTPEAGSYGDWYKRAEEAGAMTGVMSSIFDATDAETQLRRLWGQKELDKYRSINQADDLGHKLGGFSVKIGDAFARFGAGETKTPVAGWMSRNLVSATARLNESTEQATRTVVFKMAYKKFVDANHSPEVAAKMAANIAKNTSTNFNRRGNASSLLNQLFPFFNAAMQGSARLAETVFEKKTFTTTENGVVIVDEKTKLSKYGYAALAGLQALGALQAGLLAIAGFDDDEPPRHVRDRNFIIPYGNGNYGMIPMPHGLNTIINFGREMTQAMIYPKKASEHIGNAIWQPAAFNPFGSAGNLFTDFMPAIVDPFVSIVMNRDAFNRPISKEDRDQANQTPGFTRAKEGASTLGRSVSQFLNTVSGGNDDRKGAISPTPDMVDFVMGQVTGGVGREISKVALVVEREIDKGAGREVEPLPSYKKPLIGRLFGNTQEPAELRAKMFDLRKEINATYAEYKGMRDRGERAEAKLFWDEHPELALRGNFERFAKRDSKMRKERAVARSAGDISQANKITNQQDERLLELVGQYRELKAK